MQGTSTHRAAASAARQSASVSKLLSLQSESGAFVASPDFEQYNYCWLRDSSFIGYALDRAGEHDASSRFHAWVDRTIGAAGIGYQIEAVIADHLAGKPLAPENMPPARFSLDGDVVVDDWPNFQIDGYGTWLWALKAHLELSGREGVPSDLFPSVERTARYLSELAFEPCYDIWEENGGEVHTSTLACVHAGLVAAATLLGNPGFERRASEVKDYLVSEAEKVGIYPKSNKRLSEVDASAILLAEPFHVVPGDDAYMQATIGKIETVLAENTGVRRYFTDTYFGGGAWPVLTCLLGCYYSRAGRYDDAEQCLDWTEARFDEKGRLDEQIGGELTNPDRYNEWTARWGSPAADLLWSHAMYVVLVAELTACQTRSATGSDRNAGG